MDKNAYVASLDEIVPGLWIGNQAASEDPNIIRDFDVVINCTKHLEFADTDKPIARIRIAVNDPGRITQETQSDIVAMRAMLPTAVSIINKALTAGKRVFVHCHAGAQRSAIVVLGYLIVYQYKGPFDARYAAAFQYMLDKRPVVFAYGYSVNFKKSLG